MRIKANKNIYRTKDLVTFGYDSQTFQAVLLPRPENIDTVSQPVSLNQSGRALHSSSPSKRAYS